MSALITAFAALAGIILGYWMRHSSAKSEKALLDQRNSELAAALATANGQLAQAQADSAARAGFESLAAERERTIGQLIGEKNRLGSELQAKGDEAAQAAATIAELNAKLANEQKNLAEKLALLDTAKQTLANQFQSLASEILEQKSKSFSEASQKELQPLLAPLRTQIEDFRKKVEEAQSDSKTGVTKLETLIGALNGLNQQLSEDARNLTTALRGSSKAQGDWGEFILRDLLEKAGLREGEQYSFQQPFSGIAGQDGDKARSVRTDVILFLPGGRNLIIDSKVSLNAYTDSVNAQTDEARKAALKQHINSVRTHIAGLSKAGYHRLPGVEAPDFVVMFVPVEPAFLLALQNDAALWAFAYEQGILLVGPTTLLYIIRIVNVLWEQEKQARNVKEVMDRGAELYDKFVGFVEDLEKVGNALRTADQSYSNAMKKLSEGRGNLVRQVEMLKQLGIRTTKSIPPNLLDRAGIEEPTLTLAAEAEAEDASNELN